jgi:hypothetical protein
MGIRRKSVDNETRAQAHHSHREDAEARSLASEQCHSRINRADPVFETAQEFLRSKRPDGPSCLVPEVRTSQSQPSFAIIMTYGLESWRPVSKSVSEQPAGSRHSRTARSALQESSVRKSARWHHHRDEFEDSSLSVNDEPQKSDFAIMIRSTALATSSSSGDIFGGCS